MAPVRPRGAAPVHPTMKQCFWATPASPPPVDNAPSCCSLKSYNSHEGIKVSDEKQAQGNILLLSSFSGPAALGVLDPLSRGLGVCHNCGSSDMSTSPLQAPDSSCLSERVGWVFSLKTSDSNFGCHRSSVVFSPSWAMSFTKKPLAFP